MSIREEYVLNLRGLDHEKLYEETKRFIYLSSMNYDEGDLDCHWQVDACFAEWVDRGLKCEYERAYGEVMG